jgi:glycosyltransferase involved in cell wall biosynthesis
MTFQEFIDKYQKEPVEEYQNNVLEKVPNPMVSCRVSTYQHAPYIKQSLDGILMQKTNFPFEIVIGEDESSDRTREICIEYAKMYPDIIRLFLHKRENNILINGNPSSKFQGIYTMLQLRGKYQAICEGDDYWTDPLKLQKQVDFLEENDEYVICGSCAQVIKDGFADDIIKPTKQRLNLIDGIEGNNLPTCTILFKSDCLENFQFNIKGLGDFLLQAHVLTYGSGYCFDDIMACYRVHSGGIWSLKSNRYKNTLLLLTYIEIFKRYYKYHFKYQIIRISKINTADIDKKLYVYFMLFRIMHFPYRCYNFFKKIQ